MGKYGMTRSYNNNRKTKTEKSFSSNSSLQNYLSYNAPLIGNLKRAVDDYRFYDNYEKKHGVKVTYYGRHYGNNAKSALYEGLGAVSAVGRGSRLLSRWL